MVPVPEPRIQRLNHRLDFLAQRRPDLLLHVQTLVPRDHLVETRVEGLELLFLLVLLLAAQALDDRCAVDGRAGHGPVRRGRGVGFCVDLVEEVDGDLLPGVHVERRGFLAPLLEFGGVRGDAEVHGEVGGGADGAVEEGDGVGEEAALEGFGAVDGFCFCVEGGEEGVDDVEEVVGEESWVFGLWADGEEGGVGGVGEGELGGGTPVAVADGGEEGGDGAGEGGQGVQAGGGFGDEGDGVAVVGEDGGRGGEVAGLLEDFGQGGAGSFADGAEGVGELGFEVAGAGVEAVREWCDEVDDLEGKEAVGQDSGLDDVVEFFEGRGEVAKGASAGCFEDGAALLALEDPVDVVVLC